MYNIEATAKLKEVMKNYFTGMGTGEKKIAWCTSVGPAELLRSFGFEVYFPENHGALIGATRGSVDFIPVAQMSGFSNQVCSYTTSDIGSFLKKETPLTKHYGLENIPRPDLIVYNTNQCREVQDWFTYYSDFYKCPIAGIHPPRHIYEVTKDEIDLVVKQFKSIIPLCEEASGNKFNPDKFKEVIKLSKEATLLWQKVLKTAKASPAPIGFFNGIIQMGPIVVLRGTQEAKDYYELLLKELELNVANKIGVLKEEKIRLFWDGMPIWGNIRHLSDFFIQNNTIIAASTYCNSWIFDDFDEENPFESSALAYTKIFINRSEKAKIEYIKHWAEEFRIDGILFHDAKTCFNNSNSRFGMPLIMKNILNIPVMVIEGDLNDMRFYSEGQNISKMETFLEQIETRKMYS